MGSEIRKTRSDDALKTPQLHEAAIDFRYLLNRVYPRKVRWSWLEITINSLLMSVTFSTEEFSQTTMQGSD